MVAVRLEHVSKQFARGVKAVDDVDLTIASGEFFTLLGPSGCGKTTTLRMVAGFVMPTAGRILFGDRDVTRLPPNARDAGMVFQNYALFPHLSVGENVAFGLEARKVPKAAVRRRVGEALEQVQLGGFENRRIDQISGGQQQRVALARALVIAPKVLLLDEPLSNLDAKLREETRAEIRRIQREAGITAIYVTHDQAEALAMSDRIAVMHEGRVHQLGTPHEIYDCPATRFVATFIGKNNLLPGTVAYLDGEDAVVALAIGSMVRVEGARRNPVVALAPNAQVTVAARPEAFEVASADGPGTVSGTVVRAEFVGSLTEYALDAGGQPLLVSLVGNGTGARPGDRLRVAVRPERAFLVE
jgi:iron(III) transport system ATP-binding protein